jgi:hypothetical protein
VEPTKALYLAVVKYGPLAGPTGRLYATVRASSKLSSTHVAGSAIATASSGAAVKQCEPAGWGFKHESFSAEEAESLLPSAPSRHDAGSSAATVLHVSEVLSSRPEIERTASRFVQADAPNKEIRAALMLDSLMTVFPQGIRAERKQTTPEKKSQGSISAPSV